MELSGLRQDLAGEVQVDAPQLDAVAIADFPRREGQVPGQPARTGNDACRGVALLPLHARRPDQL